MRLHATAADGASALALTDAVALIGAVDDVETALDPEPEKLASNRGFEHALGDLDMDEERLAFATYAVGGEVRDEFLEGLGGLARYLGDDPYAVLGLDDDEPLAFEVGVDGRNLQVDFSFAASGEPDVDAIRALTEEVPKGAEITIGDPVVTPYLLRAAEAGVKAAAAKRGGGDVAAGLTVLEKEVGFDPLEAFSSPSGAYAFYSKAGPGRGIAIGITAAKKPSASRAAVTDALTFALASIKGSKLGALPLGDAGVAVTAVADGILPLPIALAEYDDRVEVAFGTRTESLESAVGPAGMFPESRRLLYADQRIGGEFYAIGFADLPIASSVISILAPESGLEPLRSSQGGYLVLGALENGNRLNLRARIEVPRNLLDLSGPLDVLPGSLGGDAVASAGALPSGQAGRSG